MNPAMDKEQQPDDEPVKKPAEKPGRGWTTRFTGQVRYRRYTDWDDGGRAAIIIKFELAPNQTDLPQEVYDVLQEMKYLKLSQQDGGGRVRSGLEFKRSKTHGRVWILPDNPAGRTAADVIDAKLLKLAEKLDREEGPDR
jgi:hypothetical protein